MSERIFVATYNHEYGMDTRAFRTEAAAIAWRDELGKSWWDTEFPDDEMPSENVGKAYFDRMWDHHSFCESFIIDLCEIED